MIHPNVEQPNFELPDRRTARLSNYPIAGFFTNGTGLTNSR